MTPDRILSRLDGYLNKNDYVSAEKHLLFWLSESKNVNDRRTELLVRSELMGLYRKLGRKEEAFFSVAEALSLIDGMGVGESLGSATVYLNAATVYKAFGEAADSLPLFKRAREIYERDLPPSDSRLAGLYNNMGLTLVDLSLFEEALELYQKALSLSESPLELAMTYLNMADLKTAEIGPLDAEGIVNEYLDTAEALLDGCKERDGYYAFVCEKCASVFGYYGRFLYEKVLKERVRSIYSE